MSSSNGGLPTAIEAAWLTLESDTLQTRFMQDSLTADAHTKQAFMKLALAEDMISKATVPEQAVRTAQEAVDILRIHGQSNGPLSYALPYALRLLVHAHRVHAESLRYAGDTEGVKEISKKAEAFVLAEADQFHLQGDKRGEASMMLSQAEVNLHKRGPKKRDQAIASAEAALRLCRDARDKELEASTQVVLAHICAKVGKVEVAGEHAQSALDIFTDLENRSGMAKAHTALALTHACMGALSKGIDAASQALSLYEGLVAKKMQAVELYIIGRWRLAQNDSKKAVVAATRAFELLKEVGFGFGWSAAAEHLAAVAEEGAGSANKTHDKELPQGRHLNTSSVSGPSSQHSKLRSSLPAKEKIVEDKRVLPPFDDPSLRLAQDQLLLFRGGVLKWLDHGIWSDDSPSPSEISKSQLQQLMQVGKDEQAASSEAGDKSGQARAAFTIANVYRLSHNYPAAARSGIKTQALYRSVGDKAGEWRTLCWLVALHMLHGQSKEAARMAREASRISCWMSDTIIIDTSMLLAQSTFDALILAAEKSKNPKHILLSQGDEALRVATEAANAAKGIGESYRTAEALLLVGRIAFALSQPATALAAAAEAVPIFSDLGDNVGEAGSRLLEAEVQLQRGRLQEAYDAATQAKALARAAGDAKVEQRCLSIIQQVPPKPAEMPQQLVQPEREVVQPTSVHIAMKPETPIEPVGLSLAAVKSMVMKVGKDVLTEDEELFFDVPLMDVGLDSLSALGFRNQLNTELGLKLPGTLMFDYPTMNDVANHIAELTSQG